MRGLVGDDSGGFQYLTSVSQVRLCGNTLRWRADKFRAKPLTLRKLRSNSVSKSKTYDICMMKSCGVSQYEVLPPLSSKLLGGDRTKKQCINALEVHDGQ